MSARRPLTDVKLDIALGRSLGVTGTPVLFANGKRIAGYREGTIQQIVEHILTEGAQGPGKNK